MTLLCVDIFLTRRCNLNCSYCYIKEKDNTPIKDEVKRNLDVCNWIVNEFRKNAPINLPKEQWFIEMDLFGGEPVLAWDSIKAIVEWKKTITDIKLDILLITNMTLIDEEKIDFCNENKITIRPSVDGCKEAMEILRKPHADKIFENCKLLVKKCNYRWCRSVVTPETVRYMFDSVKFLIKELGFVGVIQVLASGVKWKQEDLDIAKEQTTKTTDWWIQEMREGNYYFLHGFKDTLQNMMFPNQPVRPCMSGLACGAIDTNGDIYPCHRFCNSTTPKEFKMGNIYDGGITNRLLTDKLAKFNWKEYKKQHCGDCVAISACRSVCMHDAISSGKDIYEPLHRYCEMTKLYYTEAHRAHNILKKENNTLYYKMYAPLRER